MDLNYLYQRRGIETYMARNGACKNSREAHGAFARAYEARIDRFALNQPRDAA